MVIWSNLEASCPVCSRRTRLRLVGSGFVSGQDSDLLLRMKPRHIIQVEVHTCPGCRYSGYADDFLRSLPPPTAARFARDVSPRLVANGPSEGDGCGDGDGRGGRDDPRNADPRRSTPLPDVQYAWASRTAEAIGLSPLAQGERLLRAYWCLRLPPSSLLPAEVRDARKRSYLRGAIRKLREGLAESQEPNLTYLIAELCRRNGNFRLAATYFRKFLEAERGARYLRGAATKLLHAAKDRVSQEMTMEELLFDATPGESRGGTS